MKKIILLSLFSVFCLSAFCQLSYGGTEILAKFNITKYIDEKEIPDDPYFLPWLFHYDRISTDFSGNLICIGIGRMPCLVNIHTLLHSNHFRDLPTDLIEASYENITEESDALVAQGLFKGSLTKKIAIPETQSGGKQSFILLQMNWDYDPQKPYNGKAEIIISKTNDFELR